MSDDYTNIVVWPFQPDGSQPIAETFGYLTDLIISGNGTEQRIRLREVPNGKIEHRLTLLNRSEAQYANALLHGHLSGPFGVGRWQFCTPLGTAAEAGDSMLVCDTTYLPFAVGGFVLIWRDPWHVEYAIIEDIEAGALSIDGELASDWPVPGTYVMPMVVGRFSRSEAIDWDALELCTVDAGFDVDGFAP